MIRIVRKFLKKVVLSNHILNKIYIQMRTIQNRNKYSDNNTYLESNMVKVDLKNDNYMFVFPNDEKSEMYVDGSAWKDILNILWSKAVVDADFIFDIGSNYGQFFLSLNPSILKSNVKIYSFEPNPYLQKALKESISFSKIGSLVELYNCGLSNESGSFEFYLNLVSSGGSSLNENYAVNPHKGKFIKKITVDVEVLDNLIDTHSIKARNKNIAIKIDIEGNDFYALLGAKDTIFNASNVFIIIETTVGTAEEFNANNSGFLNEIFKKIPFIYATYNNSIFRVKSVTEYMDHFTKTHGSIDLVFSSKNIS